MEGNKRLEFLITYLSHSDPNAVNRVGYKYGYIPASCPESRMGLLITGLQDHGDDFLRDMILNHPDRELILSAEDSGKDNTNPSTVRLNADGEIQTISSKDPASIISNADSMSKSDTYRIIIILLVVFVLYKIFA